MKNLTESDKNYFLTSGVLTYPFVSNEYVLEKVLCDYNAKLAKGIKTTKIESLFNWINKSVKFGDNEFNNKFRFQRTAEEIWNSKIMTGCTDYATVFATFARQIGIPTTILHTAEKVGWIKFSKIMIILITQDILFVNAFMMENGFWLILPVEK